MQRVPSSRGLYFFVKVRALDRERLTGFEMHAPVGASLGLFLPRKLGRKVFDFADFLSGREALPPLDTVNCTLPIWKCQLPK